MVRAKKTLYQEAKEAKDKMKKMYKNSDASSIQEIKVYISTLEGQRENLRKQVDMLKKTVGKRIKEEDFNNLQVKKFNTSCQKIRAAFDKDLKTAISKHEEYKI